MKITFIRHGFLLSPFNDYGTLTLNELSRLALQIIDPTIDLIKTAKKIKKAGYLDKKYDKVFVSASKRTQDTAREINKYIDIPQFIISKELNEILFDPTQLITKAEYQNEGMQILRLKLFKSLSNNSNIESGSNIVQRLMKLDALLKGLNCDSVLIITHGFLLRFLDIYYQKKSKVFDEKTLNNVTNYDFLSGFTVITNF